MIRKLAPALLLLALAAVLFTGRLPWREKIPPAVAVDPLGVPETSYPGMETEPSLSPDGSTLLYGVMEDGVNSLWVRRLDALEATRLEGTEGANYGSFSPDSREVVFRIAKPCARCVVTTVDQETGERGSEPLRTLSTYRSFDGQVLFGQNLVHEGRGVVRVGDSVVILDRARNG